MKSCPKCAENKALEEFHKNRSNKDGRADWCKACTNARYQADPDRFIAAARARYWADPAAARAAQSELRLSGEHRDRENSRGDRNYRRTDTEILAKRDVLRPDGLKRCRACREWLTFAEYHNKRRLADGLDSSCRRCRMGEHQAAAIKSFAIRGLTGCVYCGGAFEHVDHVYPISKGGADHVSNMVPSCRLCNQTKSATLPSVWLAKTFPGQDIEALANSWGVRVTL